MIRFIIFSNLLISFSAGFLCFAIAKHLNIELSLWYGIFVFGSTLFTYNFQRIVKFEFVEEDLKNERLNWINKHIFILKVISLVGILLAIWAFVFYLFNPVSLLLLVPLAIVSVLYAYRFLDKKSKNLRDLQYVKLHLIGLVWSASCVLFPALNESIIEKEILILFLIIYLYIIAITIPFDIRDLKFDDVKQKTLPQVLGENNSKLVANILLLSSFTLFLLIENISTTMLISLTVAYLIQAVLIYNTSINKNELYFSGWIDGSILVLAITIAFF